MIYGMPGVGKSELAVYAAHEFLDKFSRYARRGHLQMVARQVDLHGLDGLARTDPRNALRELLDLVSPDPRREKMNLDDLSAEWREYLQGKFLVLVLDNAADEDQVLPFLPGGSSSILLITGGPRRTGGERSRHQSAASLLPGSGGVRGHPVYPATGARGNRASRAVRAPQFCRPPECNQMGSRRDL